MRDLEARYGFCNLVQFSPPMGFIRDPQAVETCLRFVEAHSPFRFCLLAVGAPQQEILAERLQARGVARGLALCVGAAIDFVTGTQRRAPPWMQNAGLEWLFRLGENPARMATRYLVRGPRVFGLLRKTKFVLRARSAQAGVPAPHTIAAAA
jgi:UDP-N-acetyl-D-mannosaminuronic acid transferase (WecB/TagA/CpsF family)